MKGFGDVHQESDGDRWGIAGISASIDLGNAGYEVVLVEKLPSIGAACFNSPRPFPRWTVRSAH